MCINVFVQIYTSAYIDMGLLMKALEIIWTKPMHMQYNFPCGGGMHLLIAGFASIGYLHGEVGPRELSFEFEFVCSLWLWYFLFKLTYYFWCLCCWQCKTKLVWKRVWQSFVMRLLSFFASSSPCCGLFCSVWMWQFLVVLTYFCKLTFSTQFLKVVLQEQQNFLWWCPLSFAWVLGIFLTLNQTQKRTDNCN